LQVSQRNLAFLLSVKPLEELVEAEGDVVGLLLLLLLFLGIIPRRCLQRWGWGWRWRRRRCLSTGSGAMPYIR
jgi:hypothetical protein